MIRVSSTAGTCGAGSFRGWAAAVAVGRSVPWRADDLSPPQPQHAATPIAIVTIMSVFIRSLRTCGPVPDSHLFCSNRVLYSPLSGIVQHFRVPVLRHVEKNLADAVSAELRFGCPWESSQKGRFWRGFVLLIKC